jgi:COMPASS component BRE2
VEAVKAGARPGFDDGMVGYIPAISLFNGGIAQVNFGPDFWYPPEELQCEKDTHMADSDTRENQAPEGRKLHALGDRFKEQIAEDVVWDIIDEVDFFMQDGGWEYKGEAPQDVAGKSTPRARGFVNPDENLGVEVGKRY